MGGCSDYDHCPFRHDYGLEDQGAGMKTKILAHISVLIVGLAIGMMVASCAGTRIKQLSGDEFLKEAQRTDQVNSILYTDYIGSTPERAYLESGYPALIGRGMRTTVYWVPVSDLPGNVVSQLKSGIPPWTNWMQRVSQSKIP